MELTLELPDELEERLRANEARLEEILELGLAALEDDPPTPEELVAYSRRQLDDEAREALAERLALDAGAVDDLLDLEGFEALEPPSEAHQLDDDDVARALGALRSRVAAEAEVEVEVEVESPEPDATPSAPSSPTEDRAGQLHATKNPALATTIPTLGERRPPRRALGAWMALAAGLLLAVVGLWPGEGTAFFGHPISIETHRDASPVFTMPTEATNLLLTFEDIKSPVKTKTRLVISTADGRKVFEKRLEAVTDPDSRLVVSLDSDLLTVGTYRLELLDARTGEALRPASRFRIVPSQEK